MFLRTCMVSISSSKEMSHCVPPFDVGNATTLISLVTSPVNQSSSDRLLKRFQSSSAGKNEAATQNKRQPETETREVQVRLLTLPDLYRDVGIINHLVILCLHSLPVYWRGGSLTEWGVVSGHSEFANGECHVQWG